MSLKCVEAGSTSHHPSTNVLQQSSLRHKHRKSKCADRFFDEQYRAGFRPPKGKVSKQWTTRYIVQDPWDKLTANHTRAVLPKWSLVLTVLRCPMTHSALYASGSLSRTLFVRPMILSRKFTTDLITQLSAPIPNVAERVYQLPSDVVATTTDRLCFCFAVCHCNVDPGSRPRPLSTRAS